MTRRDITRVFVFCRPYLVPDFQANVESLGDGFVTKFVTDGRSRGITDTRARFYERLNHEDLPPLFDAELEGDIIERCRFLRNLPRAQATKMLRSMASVLNEEVEAFNPDVFLSHMVDDYVTHILSELARRRGQTYVGFAYSYFPGKVQVTRHSNGAPLDLREPDDAEVSAVLAEISQRTFRQNYLQKPTYSRRQHAFSMARYRVKQVVFAVRGQLENDPLHMHYACLPFVVERRRWTDFPSRRDFHQDWRERTEGSRKPLVYLPLGYFPEATIDYWIGDRKILQYESMILEICRLLGSSVHVVVKEHLHMLGARRSEFYREIMRIPGVTSVPPTEYSNDVVARADAVVVGGGSIGVESFIRGKPLFSFCDTSYWFSPSAAIRLDLGDISGWSEVLRRGIDAYSAPDERERFEFLRQCLRSTMKTARPGRRWPVCDVEDLRSALQHGSRAQ